MLGSAFKERFDRRILK